MDALHGGLAMLDDTLDWGIDVVCDMLYGGSHMLLPYITLHYITLHMLCVYVCMYECLTVCIPGQLFIA